MNVHDHYNDLKKVVFLHIGWGKKYNKGGIDEITSNHKYVEENRIGGESSNFRDIDGYYYGYAPVSHGAVELGHFGEDNAEEYVDGVTIVWTATAPKKFRKKGLTNRRVVGWYQNATVYRHLRNDIKEHGEGYIARCKVEDAVLLPATERTFCIPTILEGNDGFPANVVASWFPYDKDEEQKAFAREVLEYIKQTNAEIDAGDRVNGARGGGRGKSTPEHRRNVELAAMDKVKGYYLKKGYDVQDVSAKNKGWDMEATKGDKTLILEIKGVGGSAIAAELTPNEYMMMKKERQFHLCIVTSALKKKPKLHIFRKDAETGLWCCKQQTLKIKEKTGAVVSAG